MYVNTILLNGNPFFEAYSGSDVLGKLIFLGLYALSICSWTVLLHKLWVMHQAKKHARHFYEAFLLQKLNPLNLDCDAIKKRQKVNPFLDLYQVLKKQCLDVLAKNRHFNKLIQNEAQQEGGQIQSSPTSLSLSDMDYVASQLSTQVARQVKFLEKNLYILSTTVSLAPFLGLLGTVWGILVTFSEMQSQTAGSNQMFLGGLSLALATTVLGLIDVIPALIGFNYLKNSIREFTTEMDGFSNDILAAVEMQYRRVDN